MADNTVLNAGTGGDTVRGVNRSGSVKTQVVQIDAGGVAGNAELLITAGQQTMAASLPVVIASNQSALSVSGTVTANAGTGTFAVSAASLPLPTGAGTAANQATIISTLSAIDAGIPVALGQTTMASSMPVTIASNQSAVPVSGTFWQTTQPVSIASLPSLATGSNAIGSITNTSFGISGTLPAFAAIPTFKIDQTTPGTTNLVQLGGTLPAFAATPTVNLGTIAGVATSANQPTVAAAASTSSGQTGTVGFGFTTTSAPTYTTAQSNPFSLTTGGALRGDVSSVGGTAVTLGQKVMALSLPVTLASDQGALTVQAQGLVATTAPTLTNGTGGFLSLTLSGGLRVDGSGVTQPISAASLPLPTGAATSANQVLPVAQGSTTSGQTGPLLQAAVTTNAPTYTNATTNPLSLTTGGALRVDASAANVGTVPVINIILTDQASAAITTTTTGGANQPSTGPSFKLNINVSAVSGTSPTLDVVVQESTDSGNTWFDIYHFARITATGSYNSPILLLTGNRIRVVETVGGTTPSFTRSRTRQPVGTFAPAFRRILDRTVAVNTLNSTTTTVSGTPLETRDCRNLELTINMGTITTTAPALQLQKSEDGGVTWTLIGSPLTTVASSTVSTTLTNIQAELVRAIVTTAGVGATLGWVSIKGF